MYKPAKLHFVLGIFAISAFSTGLILEDAFSASDIEGYPDVITSITKGITKCETEKEEFCGGFKTKTKLNLEVTDLSDKTLSGIGTGKIVLEHPGDILELHSNSIYWMTDGLPHECQIIVKGTLYDDLDNSYQIEATGFWMVSDSVNDTKCFQSSKPIEVYFENTIKDHKNNVFSGQELGYFPPTQNSDGTNFDW